MAPTETIVIKLDIMGENCCARWHQDSYTGRAIVSYNCIGTEYAPDANVDFWELENCGNNKCIIKDPSNTFFAGIGDFLFMKGKTFPSIDGGLVHRSPDIQYHADGKVKNRLLLKVDLP